MSPAERAAAAIDWRRLRHEVLEPLLAGVAASWHPFDFAAGTRPDGTYPMAAQAETREPAAVIVLDGAYSSRPELADLIDLAVLVDVPVPERHRRIAVREERWFAEAWHARLGRCRGSLLRASTAAVVVRPGDHAPGLRPRALTGRRYLRVLR